MKKILAVCLVLALFTVMGCGNKPQTEDSKTDARASAAEKVSLIDPVDGSKIENFENAKYSFVYDGIEYRFNKKENYEAFKKDPVKYLSK